ncbi:transcriptional regulator with XRE-family HTH domain [Pelomonas aquatica]|uniref:Transcriptional regulator with XRE-family HTH domain n=1 Tax=Pelomonas aquatica TaxID=431058 RepID=A0ABU1Z9N8_9BURK|nr:helix-turn-helix transcriptional regulator [Pelomonas aquatica]MDR7297337.1 transcriptional regulator with XRE-family HTH domain [Pelomonas aquatica]
MSSTQSLVALIKGELKSQGISYAELAQALDLSESSVKRMLAPGGEMPLSRVDEICRVLKLEFAELASRLAAQAPTQRELSLEQEKAVVADPKLLLVAICCLSLWALEDVLARYRLSEADAVAALVKLDRLGVIELRPNNRYKLKVAKTLRWRPQGPVMTFFRERVMADFFAGGFDGEGELLTLVHGEFGAGHARELAERLQRAADDFARQHLLDQKLPSAEKRPYSVVIGLRSWVFEAFRDLERPGLGQRKGEIGGARGPGRVGG